MACNKVITKDGRTLLDLTEDDVAQEDVLQGKKFHGRDGVGKTGTLVLPDVNVSYANKVAIPTSGTLANVYCDTTKTEAEIYEILNNLTYTQLELPLYVICLFSDHQQLLLATKISQDAFGFGLIGYNDDTGFDMSTFIPFFATSALYEMMGIQAEGGWNAQISFPYAINKTIEEGSFGKQNELIKDLIYSRFDSDAVTLSGNYDGMPLEITTPTINVKSLINQRKLPLVINALDTSDATATASDILNDKTAYVNGIKITGTMDINIKSVTKNGTYYAYDDNMAGYSQVNVQVPYLLKLWNLFIHNGQESGGGYVSSYAFAFWSTQRTVFSYITDEMLQQISDNYGFSQSPLVLSTSHMFDNCILLTTVPLFDTRNVEYMDYMFIDCKSLVAIPTFNTSSVTTMAYMFMRCSSLTTIPSLDCSNVSDMTRIFGDAAVDGCPNLTSILMTNIGADLNVTYTGLTHDALVTLIGNLKSGVSGKTLTMGATKLALLSSAEIQVATQKGWTLN